MRLMPLLLLSTIVSLAGCIPPRPQVDFCVIDYLPLAATIHMLEQADNPEAKVAALESIDKAALLHCSDGKEKKYDVTWRDADTFVATSARDSEKLTTYVLELEKALTNAQSNK
jgi:hypothetical protein